VPQKRIEAGEKDDILKRKRGGRDCRGKNQFGKTPDEPEKVKKT